MECSFPPELTEDDLSAALDGEADAVVRAHLAQCAACSARLDQARRMEERLHRRLLRFQCPDMQQLGDYALNVLDGAEQDVVAQHVRGCPRCQGELDALRAFMETDEFAEPPAPTHPKPAHRPRPNAWYARPPQGSAVYALRGDGMTEPLMLEVNGITIFLETGQADGGLWLVGRLLVADFAAWQGALVELRQGGSIVTVASVDPSAGFRCRLPNQNPFDLTLLSRTGIALVVEGINFVS